MRAQTGDELTVQGRRQGDEARHGVILEVRGERGAPPYLVRWADGHESVLFPTSGTLVEHHPSIPVLFPGTGDRSREYRYPPPHTRIAGAARG